MQVIPRAHNSIEIVLHDGESYVITDNERNGVTITPHIEGTTNNYGAGVKVVDLEVFKLDTKTISLVSMGVLHSITLKHHEIEKDIK